MGLDAAVMEGFVEVLMFVLMLFVFCEKMPVVVLDCLDFVGVEGHWLALAMFGLNA